MNARAVLLVFGLWLASVAHAADDHNAIFQTALDSVEFDFDERWAFTETRIDSEHVWVGRFDPRRSPSERWQIVSVDGREPTDKEVEGFLKEKAHDHSGGGDKQVNAMVEKDSIRLIEETSQYWLFGFTPEDDQAVMDSVDATIRVNKNTGQLQYIDIRNHKSIKPGYGVKISKLITRLTFGPAIEGGPVVPLSTQVEVKGRAYFVISFDEEELTRNSEFEYVVDR
ncbi:MAG: hypothetical protein ACR2QZ_16960 [Woeseiaceae bacterium]